jgi:hypothetical protein
LPSSDLPIRLVFTYYIPGNLGDYCRLDWIGFIYRLFQPLSPPSSCNAAYCYKYLLYESDGAGRE